MQANSQENKTNISKQPEDKQLPTLPRKSKETPVKTKEENSQKENRAGFVKLIDPKLSAKNSLPLPWNNGAKALGQYETRAAHGATIQPIIKSLTNGESVTLPSEDGGGDY